jgi:fatty acid hydroxylase domain-containing protein 2
LTGLVDNNKVLVIYGFNVLVIIYHWILVGIFTIFDFTKWPQFLKKYKIQPETNDPADKRKLFKMICLILFNQLFLNLGATWYAIAWIEYFKLWHLVKLEVPSFEKFIVNLVCCCMIYEILFYYLHRLLHHKWIYKYVHKVHHEWKSPIALASQYCHPVEHYVCNILPISGIFIVQPEVSTVLVFWLFVTTNNMIGHCGLNLPFLPSPEFHDYHHSKFTECYSTNGLLDQIHGTCDSYTVQKLQKIQAMKGKTSEPIKIIQNQDSNNNV